MEKLLVILFLALSVSGQVEERMPKCPSIDDPTKPIFFPHETECDAFYSCIGGRPWMLRCLPGLFWSESSNSCEWPEAAQCDKTSTEIPPDPPTENPPENDPRCPIVSDPTNPIHIPHDTNCSLFYTCIKGEMILLQCPSGLHWNNEFNRCDWPEAAKCFADFPTPSPTISMTIPALNPPVQGQNCVSGQPEIPHASNCSLYYSCRNGILNLYECPPGLHWYTEGRRCEWPHVANCDAVTTTPNPRPTSPNPGQTCSGQIVLPHPTNCSIYYSCNNGFWHLYECPPGLHWFAEGGRCEWPHVAQCNAENPGIDGKCPPVDDPLNPVHLPHESDCNLFYKCTNGDPVLFKCPANLHWSIKANRCEWPDEANCQLGGTTQSTTSIFTTTKPVTTTNNPESDPRCPIIDDPWNPVHIPHETNCGLFYTCVNRCLVLQKCPSGLHWSSQFNRCEWPHIANCESGGSTESTPLVTQSTTTILIIPTLATTTNNPEFDARCPIVDDPLYPVHIPHETDCSLFYSCSNRCLVLQKCPSGLHWSSQFNRCEWPHIANCELGGSTQSTPLTTQSTTTPKITTTTVTTTNNPEFDARCPIVDDPWNPVHIPHETDCGLFYTCSNGYLVLQKCPSGLHWSSQFNRCEWPHIANCELGGSTESTTSVTQGTPSTTTTQITTTNNPIPTPDPRCPAIDDPQRPVHLPHERDCTLFYTCSNGFLILFRCPEGLHWSIEKNRCEWPHIANCELGGSTIVSVSTTTISNEITTPIQPKPDPRCPETDDPFNPVHLPHECDCSSFYSCERGFLIVFKCPSGLHWSIEFNRCEWPEIAKCDLNDHSIPTAPTRPTDDV